MMAGFALNKCIYFNVNHPIERGLKNHSSSSLGQRYEQLLLSEKYSDCIFLLSGNQIKCHKLILASASPVFEAMFYGPVCEQTHLIDILDMNEHVFRHLIYFIYKGCLDFQKLTLEETIELYYGAEKYLMQELINQCLEAIQMKLRFSNILPALELSVCLDLQHLLNICLTFFKRCCLGETPQQFRHHLKAHYYHITKECLNMLFKNFQLEKYVYECVNEYQAKNLLEFFHEWYKAESQQNDLTKLTNFLTELDSDIVESIKAIENNCANNNNNNNNNKINTNHYKEDALAMPNHILSVERCYYKACRPFIITSDTYEWFTFIRCNRFIALHGLTLNSRLLSNFHYGYGLNHTNFTNTSTNGMEYMENFCITITSLQSSNNNDNNNSNNNNNDDNNDNNDGNCQPLTWSWNVEERPVKYNCNLIIKWPYGVILSVDMEYQIKLQWAPSLNNGAEYPCSLMSDQVDSICFRDQNHTSGALIKGLHYVHLN